MKKKKLPLVCWDSIKLLTALFLLWGVCFGADAYPGSEYRKQLFDYDWKFKLGDYPDASLNTYDDADWRILDLPHDWSIEGTLDPENPMGNDGGYFPAGTGWYRKSFEIPSKHKGKKVGIYFEGVYMNSEVFINGKSVGIRPYGYSSFYYDLTPYLRYDDKNIIAVRVDNSQQKNCRWYTGTGIYRHVWLTAMNAVHIEHWGIAITTPEVSEERAVVQIKTILRNETSSDRQITLTTKLTKGNDEAGKGEIKVDLPANGIKEITQKIFVLYPALWSPETPHLYNAHFLVTEASDVIDSTTESFGIRTVTYSAEQGLFLNGKRIILNGGCLHHDNGCLGAAAYDRAEERKVELMKAAGFNAVRTSHNIPSEEFLHACDRLGLLVIDETFDGWRDSKNQYDYSILFDQWWQRDIESMVLRDRNHPSVLMWEPILNETRYPLDFALKALDITKEEYPYPGRPVAAADVHSAGVKEHYDVVYGWPGDDEKEDRPEQCIFTREFGENVDDWYAHNNDNRASRSWGEHPLLVQALSLAKSYDEMYRTTGLFIGGAQWHPFDHQRGYHPDPYWGGLYDAFRQKKYAYEMFRSQSSASLRHPLAECGPMVFVAHEMSQFSDKDVVVFSNCDSVRLSVYDGTKTWTKPVVHAKGHLPNAPVVFENVWDFWEARSYSYTQKNWQKVNMIVEGIINGKVVCTQKKMPSRRSTKLRLYADTGNVNLVADGSDFIVVVAEVTDDNGNVRRLAKENIVFTVEGEGDIIGDATIGANPRAVEFGSAPVLIRSTRKAGKIKVKARVLFEGTQAPTAAELEFESVPAEFPFCYEEREIASAAVRTRLQKDTTDKKIQLTEEERQKVLDEVERQQTEFGTKE